MKLSAHIPLPSTFLARIAAVFSCCWWSAFHPNPRQRQTGYTGIFGGGPFYKNATNNITEIENSGFTEAIVWSVEVNSIGDLNFNGEFPLTSNGVYIGDQTHPDFAGEHGAAETRHGEAGHLQHRLFQFRRLAGHHGAGEITGHRHRTAFSIKTSPRLKAAIPALDAHRLRRREQL